MLRENGNVMLVQSGRQSEQKSREKGLGECKLQCKAAEELGRCTAHLGAVPAAAA